jgi:hypothetical protein
MADDTYFKKSNFDTTFNLFYKNVIYKRRMYGQGYKNIIDFNAGEKLLYGRVDHFFIPIKNTDPINFDSFNSAIANGQRVSAVGFVVRAFEDMAAQFKRCAAQRKISPTDQYLSNLKVYRAYENPDVLYQNYLNTYYDLIIKRFKKDKIKVADFGHFMKELFKIISKPAPEYPFTQTGYIKSKQCPINVSGFAIEIADLDVSNDFDKMEKFVESNNWDFYVTTCNKYGFMIDSNAPWRIVADLNSEAMINYSAFQGGLTDSFIIFERMFSNVALLYYKKFKYDLLRLYDKVKKSYLVQEICDGNTINKLIIPANYSIDYYETQFSDDYFLDYYFRLRIWEEETTLSNAEILNIINKCTAVAKSNGALSSIALFERFINKPFDYVGSLSYAIKSNEAKKNAAAGVSDSSTKSGGGGY